MYATPISANPLTRPPTRAQLLSAADWKPQAAKIQAECDVAMRSIGYARPVTARQAPRPAAVNWSPSVYWAQREKEKRA